MTRLTILRERQGLSIDGLAKRIRFPEESLRLMESGRYPLGRLIQASDAALSIERRLQVALGTYTSLTQLIEPQN